MRAILLFLAASLMASAANRYAPATLNPGDAVKLEPLAGASFIQGKAPASWEEGKVYIIDCWASWCGPCKITVPRLNKLYTDYQAKGLRVVGVSVFGEKRADVEAFLKGEGSEMSYPVAIADKDGAFESEWLRTADVSSLPSAFVVKNGILLFVIHSGKITNETVEALLAGGEREAAVVRRLGHEVGDEERAANEAAEHEKVVSLLLRDLRFIEDSQGKVESIDKILASNPGLHPEVKQRLILIKMIHYKSETVDETIRILDEAIALAPKSKTARELKDARLTIGEGKVDSK
jgi:thiol-disulfide isomerase/thioredoxin